MAAWGYESRVSEANEWEILSALEDKIRIPKRGTAKQQNSAIKVVTYRKMPVTKMFYLSHVKDKNSIFTARDEDMIF